MPSHALTVELDRRIVLAGTISAVINDVARAEIEHDVGNESHVDEEFEPIPVSAAHIVGMKLRIICHM